jgi:hypothetical protein
VVEVGLGVVVVLVGFGAVAVGLGATCVGTGTGVAAGSGGGGSAGSPPVAALGPGSEGTVAAGGTSIVGIGLSLSSLLPRPRSARNVVRPPITANATRPMTIIGGPLAPRGAARGGATGYAGGGGPPYGFGAGPA